MLHLPFEAKIAVHVRSDHVHNTNRDGIGETHLPYPVQAIIPEP
jgi:hypothetical protein